MPRILILLAVLSLVTLGCAGFAAAQVTQAQASLSWTDVTGEDSYRIERSDAGGPYATVGTVTANVTNFTNVALALNVQYCWQIVAQSGFGNAAPSVPACGIARTPNQVLQLQLQLTPYP